MLLYARIQRTMGNRRILKCPTCKRPFISKSGVDDVEIVSTYECGTVRQIRMSSVRGVLTRWIGYNDRASMGGGPPKTSYKMSPTAYIGVCTLQPASVLLNGEVVRRVGVPLFADPKTRKPIDTRAMVQYMEALWEDPDIPRLLREKYG